jgi:hypothetical protein
MNIGDLLDQIAENEEEALELYQLPPDTAEEELIKAFKEQGINNWLLNLELLDEISEYELDADLELYIGLVRTYTEKRKQAFELILKAIKEDSDDYEDEINALDEEIVAIIDKIEAIAPE